MKFTYILILLALFIFQSCNQGEETRNPPEIVSRDSDTVFNEVPGQHHLGKEVFNYNVVEVLKSVRKIRVFVAGLEEAGLIDTLSTEGPFTVFALTDETFPSAEKDTSSTQNVSKRPAVKLSQTVLKGHIVPGLIRTTDLAEGPRTVKSLNGNSIMLRLENGNLIINDKIRVVNADLNASNGVIHEVNQLIK